MYASTARYFYIYLYIDTYVYCEYIKRISLSFSRNSFGLTANNIPIRIYSIVNYSFCLQQTYVRVRVLVH